MRDACKIVIVLFYVFSFSFFPVFFDFIWFSFLCGRNWVFGFFSSCCTLSCKTLAVFFSLSLQSLRFFIAATLAERNKCVTYLPCSTIDIIYKCNAFSAHETFNSILLQLFRFTWFCWRIISVESERITILYSTYFLQLLLLMVPSLHLGKLIWIGKRMRRSCETTTGFIDL